MPGEIEIKKRKLQEGNFRKETSRWKLQEGNFRNETSGRKLSWKLS